MSSRDRDLQRLSSPPPAPTCNELELCCTNTPEFLKLMRVKYCCVCAMCGVFLFGVLSSLPLAFLIADYQSIGLLNYTLTYSPPPDNSSHSNTSVAQRSDYHCTYKWMVLDCSPTTATDLCAFIDNRTFSALSNASNINIDRAAYDAHYSLDFWNSLDVLMWLGCLTGFWLLLTAFLCRNARLCSFHRRSKSTFLCACALGSAALLAVSLMGMGAHSDDCRRGLLSFVAAYLVPRGRAAVDAQRLSASAHMGQTLTFMLVLCVADVLLFVLVAGCSAWRDRANWASIHKGVRRAEARAETKAAETADLCAACHGKGYWLGVLFQRLVCRDCEDSEMLIKQTPTGKLKYGAALGSVNMPS